MNIRARAPFRLGLGGGGTDVSPYCDMFGGCIVNATIDRYAYATIRPYRENHFRFEASDSEISEVHSAAPFVNPEGFLALHRAVYNEVVRDFNRGQPLAVELSTFSEAPAGSGLGSSSTLVVVMLRAITEWLGVSIDDQELAARAYRIERVGCGFEGGRQDHYAAAVGGFNFMEFGSDGRVVVSPLQIEGRIRSELEASLLFYDTGVSRNSARIIATQTAGVVQAQAKTVEALHGIKDEALSMTRSLERGDFGGIVDSMRRGWEHKKRSASLVSSERIEQIHHASCAAGALAGKVSGAGGGGYMVFFVPPDRRTAVYRALQPFGGTVSFCRFEDKGVRAWTAYTQGKSSQTQMA